MSKVALEINTLVVFDSVEQARLHGQSIASILGQDKGIKLRELPSSLISLHAPSFDRSKVTIGGQEVDARINSLVKNLRAVFPEIADEDVTGDVKSLDGKNWMVNYQQLLDNVRQFVTAEDVLSRYQEAVAVTLRNENLRGVK